MARDKTFLFVDGSNLYGSQFELFGPTKYLDFAKLIRQLEKHLKIKFDQIYFYASFSPQFPKLTKKIRNFILNEKAFYKSVYQTPNTIFFKGYRSKTSGKEKEVDVKLAVDIVHFAHRNLYRYLYLFSGDADFMHALLVAKSLNKIVSIISLENRIPHRFSYIFPTITVQTGHQPLVKLNRHQKINFINISSKLITSTTKNPPVRVPGRVTKSITKPKTIVK